MDIIENISMEAAPIDKFPRCPSCQKELDKIWTKTSGLGFKGQKEILMCPYCQTFLAYSAWKR